MSEDININVNESETFDVELVEQEPINFSFDRAANENDTRVNRRLSQVFRL